MKTLGRITALVAFVALGGAVVVGVQSIPDVKRYLKMRAM